MSEKVEALAEVIKVLAGKGSDLVLSFEDLTLDVLEGGGQTPRVSLKLKGSVRLDIAVVKE